jgi:peroxiredoxin
VKKLEKKPFALLGVNVNRHEPESLKKVMEKENINWRTFADQGVIAREWNFPATPSFYLIDQKGTIRHKWIGHPGEATIDAALERLIREVEEADGDDK